MPSLLITGAAGLVGATCVEHFSSKGWDVIGLDNGMRSHFLGGDADTAGNLRSLRTRYPQIQILEVDVRSGEAAEVAVQADAVIHCAAQTSHPRSVEIPVVDADVNIMGTLNLLEALRLSRRRDVPFLLCSSNKVYGDAPNAIPYVEGATRFDVPTWPGGFDETLPIDGVVHTPFGVSKVAADLYAQDYGRLYGIPTASFRIGCITGRWSRAAVHQNWIAYFILCALTERPLTVFGYSGKQVRDNIHARDLARAFERFIEAPRLGAIYNMGGGPGNSISCVEAIERIRALTGSRLEWKLGPVRDGDHRVYISNTDRFTHDYPGWRIEIGLSEIFDELVAWVRETLREPARPL